MFKKAVRTKLWARVAIYGPSGSGKSYTGLRIATGLAKKQGSRIAAIDTENRSLTKYAHIFDIDVCDITDKSIDNLLNVIEYAKNNGYRVLFIDSLTHSWKELLEEVDNIASKYFGGNSWAAWSKGTPKQNKLINALVNFPGHLIVTMRSKTEWTLGTEVKNGKEKTKVTRSGTSPEQGKGIEYEFDILLDISQNHVAEIQKDRTGKYQDQFIEKPDEKFGEDLFDWLNSGEIDVPEPEKIPEIEEPKNENLGKSKPKQKYENQQVIDAMNELKNIMESVDDKGEKVFSEKEYEEVKNYLHIEVPKYPDVERLVLISDLLEIHKKRLCERLSNEPSLKESLKKIAQESGNKDTADIKNADDFIDDIPGEEKHSETGNQLDIF